MAGLPCTVAAVLALAYLSTVADSFYFCRTPGSPPVSKTPEKCLNKVETGSDMSNEERQSAVYAVNLYRAFITNQCDKFKSGKPKSANFRKIRYSCDLENQVKFTCPAKANDAFTTSGTVFRRIDINRPTSILFRVAPWLDELKINGQTLDFVDNSVRNSDALRFYLLGNTGEIGCYLKKCHGKEYVACTTGQVIPKTGPLYTPGNRCRSNNDCKDTRYPICEADFGLCQPAYVCETPKSPKVSQTPEKCLNELDTGSEMSNEERQSAADAINTYRALIANQCGMFKSGEPKSANFRKIRYTCQLEAQAAFTCPKAGEKFASERRRFRRIIDSTDGRSIFYHIAPRLEDIGINNQNQIVNKSVAGADTLQYYLNGVAGAAEIGCYVKTCDGKKHLACVTHTDYYMKRPLYTAGTRCRSNNACLDPEYPICDMELGLCQQGKLPYHCGRYRNPTVRISKQACSADVDSGSLMSTAERRLTVDAMNVQRGLITNECNAWGSGKPKSANMLKVQYSCELEKRVKFACPAAAGANNWKSDGTVFRKFRDVTYIAYRTAFLWNTAPTVSEIKIDPNTQTIVDTTKFGSDFLSFALNNDVNEIGCYLSHCHRKEYIACTTGHPFDVTKPLYKPGKRCQKNADCTVPGYHICEMEYGLCEKGGSPVTTTTKKPTTTPTTKKAGQGCRKDADCTASASPVCNLQTGLCGPLTCKFSDSSLTIDACKDLRACTEATDKAEPEKQFCRSTVIIADRNNDNTFTVKGFGAAVGEKHLLASVSSKFAKYGNTELYAIVGGTTIYQLRAADVIPQIAIGDPNFNAFGDLALIKLADASTFKFTDYLRVKSVRPGPQDKSLTLRLGADKINTDNILLQPDAECVKVFHLDGVIKYVKNSNMACGLDADDKGTKFLNGAPLADVALTDGKHALHGIRSMDSLDPGHTNGFLVTKLAPNCDWLLSASDGAVKCV